MTIRRLVAVLAATALLGVLAACGGSSSDGSPATIIRGDNDGYHGVYLQDPYEIPDVALPETAGGTYSLVASPAPVQLVFFGYTHCPDVCQIAMSTIASSVVRLAPEQQEQVQVVFVTTDPERDDEATLRTYLDRFDPDFIGLTGDIGPISELAAAMKVFFERGRDLPDGGYEIDHATYIFAVKDGVTRMVWTQGTSPAELTADVTRLLS